MAFEPIYEVAVLDGLQKLCSGQVVAEAKLVPPHGDEIAKILGVSAIADVVATEVFTGEARIKGKVDFKVFYSDAEGQSRCLDYSAEFTDKITCDAITSGRPCVIAKVLDTDIVSASGSEVKLAAVVETELFGQTSGRIKYLVKGGDGIYSHEKTLSGTKVVSSFGSSTEVTAETEAPAEEIECAESRVCVTKATASANVVTVEGYVVGDIIYRGKDGVGHINLKTPYSVEIEADGAGEGNKVWAVSRIVEAKATVINGEQTTILVSYEIDVCGYVLEEKSFEVITDVFSVKNELVKSNEQIEYSVNKGCVYFEDEVNGSVTLDADLPIVDSIITPLGSSVILSNVYSSDGKIVIEGLVRTNIIYYSGESNSTNAVAVELPFSIVRQDGDGEVYATAEVLGVYAKIRRGNEIDVRAELAVCMSVSEKAYINIITDLAEGDQIAVPASAISMHVASKKETLWDVAKVLGAAPETVTEQNPELVFPLEGGERIICYRKLEK